MGGQGVIGVSGWDKVIYERHCATFLRIYSMKSWIFGMHLGRWCGYWRARLRSVFVILGGELTIFRCEFIWACGKIHANKPLGLAFWHTLYQQPPIYTSQAKLRSAFQPFPAYWDKLCLFYPKTASTKPKKKIVGKEFCVKTQFIKRCPRQSKTKVERGSVHYWQLNVKPCLNRIGSIKKFGTDSSK